MSVIRQVKSFCLANFSKPKSHRRIYRAIRRHSVRKIVEVGMGSGDRAERMIFIAGRRGNLISYTGIDEFEGRAGNVQGDDSPGDAPLSLKQAYQRLRPTGAKVQLVPGPPLAALERMANALTGTDLLVLSQGLDARSLQSAWFYVPRMLHRGTVVYLEESLPEGGTHFVRLAVGEVHHLADHSGKTYRRAA